MTTGEDEDQAHWWRGMAEGRNPFVHYPDEPAGLDDYRVVHLAVLESYDHRCAVTGTKFGPTDALDTGLRVQAIRPLALGGRLEARNFLPMIEPIALAFAAGQFTVDVEGVFMPDLDAIERDLLRTLLDRERFMKPIVDGAMPDPGALAYHRERIFTGRPG